MSDDIPKNFKKLYGIVYTKSSELTLSEDILALRLRGMHGVTLFGLVKGLQTIPEIFEGLDGMNASNQRR